MRGNRIHSRASRRINGHRATATDEFEHALLSDGVDEAVLEDDQLALIEDAIATAEDARDDRRGELDGDGDPSADIASSLSGLQETARERVLELCARQCRVVLQDASTWVDEGHVNAADAKAAREEAIIWLLDHPDVSTRLWGEGAPEDVATWVSEA